MANRGQVADCKLHVESEPRRNSNCSPLQDREFRKLSFDLASTRSLAGSIYRRRHNAFQAVAFGEAINVEAPASVPGINEALVFLCRPGICTRHDIPAQGIAPGAARVFLNSVGIA